MNVYRIAVFFFLRSQVSPWPEFRQLPQRPWRIYKLQTAECRQNEKGGEVLVGDHQLLALHRNPSSTGSRRHLLADPALQSPAVDSLPTKAAADRLLMVEEGFTIFNSD